MATIDIKRTVSLDGAIRPETLQGPLYAGEDDAHRFIIRATQDGADTALSGTVTGVFRRGADDVSVPLEGSTSDGAAIVTLIPNCYLKAGRFDLTIFVSSGGATVAVYNANGFVQATGGATTIDPGSEITLSVADLVNDIETAVASIPSSYTDMMAAIAPTFSPTAYAVNQCVWYDGELYRFIAAHAAGSWAGTDAEKIATLGGLAQGVKELNDALKLTLNPVEWLFSLYKGQRIVQDTGAVGSHAKCCRTTAHDGFGAKIAVEMTGSVYQCNMFYYDSTCDISNGTGYLGCSGYRSGMLYIPDNAVKIALSFNRLDGANMQDSDVTAIKAAVKAYRLTDDTLAKSDKAADAKAVGDRFADIKADTVSTALSALILLEFEPVLAKGSRINSTTGAVQSNSYYCRTYSAHDGAGTITALRLTGSVYEYSVAYYDSTCDISDGTGYLGSSDYGTGIKYIPDTAVKIALSFRRIDGAAMQDSDKTAIQGVLSAYCKTDTGLTMRDTPADAYTVGQKLDDIVASTAKYGLYTDAVITGWSDPALSKYPKVGGQSVGTSITYTSSGTNYQYVRVACKPGDLFVVSGNSNAQYRRAWAFTDSNDTIFSTDYVAPGSPKNVSNVILEAPSQAAYLYITRQYGTNGDSYRRITLIEKVDSAFPLSGKKIVNFGDSIFGNYRDDSGANESISHMISALTGATCYNVAFGGTHSGDSDNAQGQAIQTNTAAFDFTHLVTSIISGDFSEQTATGSHAARIAELAAIDFSQIDIITISYGTNDWSYATSITKFKSNLVDGITRMLTAFPNLIVLLCTPIIRFGNGEVVDAETQDTSEEIIYTSDDEAMKNGKNKKIPDYVTACEEVAHDYHLPLSENYWHLGMNLINRATFFGETGTVHPNAAGRRLIANRVADELRRI